MTYEQWMRAVDNIVEQICGLDSSHLPDWMSRDAYEDGLSPREGAEICLEDSGFYEAMED